MDQQTSPSIPDEDLFIQIYRQSLKILATTSPHLEHGCGIGNPVDMALAAAGHKVKGIDYSPSMIDLVRKNVPSGTFETGDMYTYEHPKEEPLNAVFNVCALFHPFRKPNEECVRSWGRWLPKSGLLCMIVLTADDYNQAKVEKYDEDGHFAKLTREFMGRDAVHTLPTRLGLNHLLHENGLEILDERMEVTRRLKKSTLMKRDNTVLLLGRRDVSCGLGLLLQLSIVRAGVAGEVFLKSNGVK